MTAIILPQAEDDIEDAFEDYEQRQLGWAWTCSMNIAALSSEPFSSPTHGSRSTAFTGAADFIAFHTASSIESIRPTIRLLSSRSCISVANRIGGERESRVREAACPTSS